MKNQIFVLAASALLLGFTQTYAQVSDSTSAAPAATTQPGNTTTAPATQAPASQSAAPANQATQTASGDLVQAITNTGYNTALATAVKTAGLESELKGAGPYTVFAPSDQAFTQAAASDSALKNPAELSKVLKHHVVEGKFTKDDVIKALTEGKGMATLTTIEGDKLTLKVNANKNLELSDAEGNVALVTAFDEMASNGVVHVINNVLAGDE